MADLLIPVIPPKIRERKFREHEIFLDDFSDEELRSRYRFGRDSIEFLTEILENDLQRQTTRNHALSPTLQILVQRCVSLRAEAFYNSSVTPSASRNPPSQGWLKMCRLLWPRSRMSSFLGRLLPNYKKSSEGFMTKEGFLV